MTFPFNDDHKKHFMASIDYIGHSNIDMGYKTLQYDFFQKGCQVGEKKLEWPGIKATFSVHTKSHNMKALVILSHS